MAWLVLASMAAALTLPNQAAALSCVGGIGAKESRENSDVEVDAVVVELASAPVARGLEVVDLIRRPGPEVAAVRIEPQVFAFNAFLGSKIRVGDVFRLYLTRRKRGLTLTYCQNHKRLTGPIADQTRRVVEQRVGLSSDSPTTDKDETPQQWVWIAVAALIATAAVAILVHRRRRSER